jgi:hypothetical protein
MATRHDGQGHLEHDDASERRERETRRQSSCVYLKCDTY